MPRPQLAEFMRRMGPDSVAILPAARGVTRSNDTEFRFRQDSDFYYLTGFREPGAVAVIAPDRDERFTLFVLPRDPEDEIWTGRRAGVEGARLTYGAGAAFPVEQFREKLGGLLSGARNLYYPLGARPDVDEAVVSELARTYPPGVSVQRPRAVIDPGPILHEMRLFKSGDEVAHMQRAADIAAEAHHEAMRHARPGMREYEVEALVEYVFRRSGAVPAYTSIVGAGANTTVIHYTDNDAEIRPGDLLLVDAGAEYEGYASDITRTFPVAGRFTGAQRDVYELVLNCQEACIGMVAPGVTLGAIHARSVEMLTRGMISFGLLKGNPARLIREGQYLKFYPHTVLHYLGMDVHDVGSYQQDGEPRALAPGMVITIEPGIYIPETAEGIPDKYRGIGVRIEDDVLVTAEGRRVLSGAAPKQIEEIETLTAR